MRIFCLITHLKPDVFTFKEITFFFVARDVEFFIHKLHELMLNLIEIRNYFTTYSQYLRLNKLKTRLLVEKIQKRSIYNTNFYIIICLRLKILLSVCVQKTSLLYTATKA